MIYLLLLLLCLLPTSVSAGMCAVCGRCVSSPLTPVVAAVENLFLSISRLVSHPFPSPEAALLVCSSAEPWCSSVVRDVFILLDLCICFTFCLVAPAASICGIDMHRRQRATQVNSVAGLALSECIASQLALQLQCSYKANKATAGTISTVLHAALSHTDKLDSLFRMLCVNFSLAFSTILPNILTKKLTDGFLPTGSEGGAPHSFNTQNRLPSGLHSVPSCPHCMHTVETPPPLKHQWWVSSPVYRGEVQWLVMWCLAR